MVKEFKFEGRALLVDLSTDADESVFEEIFVDRDYRILDDLILCARNCVLDLGAHIGLFSLYCSVLNGDVPIFSFEPEERNFRLLKENSKRNKVRNVVAKNLAVGCENGMRDLFLSEDSHNHSLVNEGDDVRQVQVVSFEEVLRKYAVNGCDLVKMDVEGAEFEIFEGLDVDVLSDIKTFYIEYHEYSPFIKVSTLRSLFEKAEFKVKIFPSRYENRMGFVFARK